MYEIMRQGRYKLLGPKVSSTVPFNGLDYGP